MTPPCYKCKHCIYLGSDWSVKNNLSKGLCGKKAAIDYYERLRNDRVAGVDPCYIRGTKYCEFKKNKNVD